MQNHFKFSPQNFKKEQLLLDQLSRAEARPPSHAKLSIFLIPDQLTHIQRIKLCARIATILTCG